MRVVKVTHKVSALRSYLGQGVSFICLAALMALAIGVPSTDTKTKGAWISNSNGGFVYVANGDSTSSSTKDASSSADDPNVKTYRVSYDKPRLKKEESGFYSVGITRTSVDAESLPSGTVSLDPNIDGAISTIEIADGLIIPVDSVEIPIPQGKEVESITISPELPVSISGEYALRSATNETSDIVPSIPAGKVGYSVREDSGIESIDLYPVDYAPKERIVSYRPFIDIKVKVRDISYVEVSKTAAVEIPLDETTSEDHANTAIKGDSVASTKVDSSIPENFSSANNQISNVRAASQRTPTNNPLQYFGYYHSMPSLTGGNIDGEKDHVNFVDVCWGNIQDDLAVIRAANRTSSHQIKAILCLDDLFYFIDSSNWPMRLKADYVAAWNTKKAIVDQFQDVIFAFSQLDEPDGRSVPQSEIETAAALVKSSYPNIPIALNLMVASSYNTIPNYHDWVSATPRYGNSFDDYIGTLSLLKSKINAVNTASGSKRVKLVVVGDGFSVLSSQTFMRNVAYQAFKWIQDENADGDLVDVVAYWVFLWHDGTGYGRPGVENSPELQAEFRAIGLTILGGGTSVPGKVSLTGRVSRGGEGLPRVRITVNGSLATTTGYNGEYTILGISTGSNLTITASRDGFSFTPESIVLNNINSNVSGKNFIARDPQTNYTLTITKAGNGTVSGSPAGISCGSDCNESYSSGTSVTLTAAPASGSTFTGWGEACNGASTCTVTMTAAKNVTATFTTQGSRVRLYRLWKGDIRGQDHFYTTSLEDARNASGYVIENEPAYVNVDSGDNRVPLYRYWSSQYTDHFYTTRGGGRSISGYQYEGIAAWVYTTPGDGRVRFYRYYSSQQSDHFYTTLGGGVSSLVGGIYQLEDEMIWVYNNLTGNAKSAIIGDANNDGQVNSLDLVAIANQILGISNTSDGADCNQDGKVNSLDLVCAANIILNDPQTGVNKQGTGSGNVGGSVNTKSLMTKSAGNTDTITLTAVPVSGSVFTGWSGANCSGTGACTIPVNTALNKVTATFTANKAQKQYSLKISKGGKGSGTVTSSPEGISCGTTCSFSYDKGTFITLTAVPDDSESVFMGWKGACSGTDTVCNVTISKAQSVNATFEKKRYPLTLTAVGSGKVSYPKGGIKKSKCGLACEGDINTGLWYLPGTELTLKATLGRGNRLDNWGDACSGTDKTCVITMSSSARSVTVTFIKQYLLKVSKSGKSNLGVVSSSPNGINCDATCKKTVSSLYDTGTTVTLTASPVTGGVFKAWKGGCVGTESTCTVAMTKAKSVTAVFAATPN